MGYIVDLFCFVLFCFVMFCAFNGCKMSVLIFLCTLRRVSSTFFVRVGSVVTVTVSLRISQFRKVSGVN